MTVGRIPSVEGGIQPTLLTAKGDLISATAASTVARLPVGSDTQILVADSTASTGLKWATPASGGGMTSIASGSLSGSNVSLTSIVGTYKNLQLIIRDFYFSVDTSLNIRLNNDTGSNYRSTGTLNIASGGGPNIVIGGQNTAMEITNTSVDNVDNNNSAVFELFDYADGTSQKLSSAMTTFTSDGYGRAMTNQVYAYYPVSAITRIDIFPASGTFSGGTYVLYGVN
jgi:hypothetical protein